MNENGYATFKSRQDIITASGGTATVFSDTGAPGTIKYQKVSFDLSDFGLINECTVTRTGGTPQTVFDSNSQNTFFTHSRNRSSIAQTDTDALNQALMIVASRNEVGTDLRLENLVIDAADGSDTTRVIAALDLDVFSPIEVIQTLQGGAVSSDTVVTGVSYDVTPSSFFTTFTIAQPFASGFVLDSLVDGLLNEDSLAY